jgi:hypothetical protein
VRASAIPEEYRSLRSFAFGDSPGLADELLELVLKGVKTATCSTKDEPNMSRSGERCFLALPYKGGGNSETGTDITGNTSRTKGPQP